jgi:hypothetical protein
VIDDRMSIVGNFEGIGASGGISVADDKERIIPARKRNGLRSNVHSNTQPAIGYYCHISKTILTR